LFIGEGPGENEDATGLPFVGRGGKLLDKMLNKINLSRDKDIYIANIVKCRPPNNRDPLPNEISSCLNYLRWQFKVIKPSIIVCLGRIAAKTIIKKDFKVTRDHGIWFSKLNIEMIGTFHPAALLRNPNNLPYAEKDFVSLHNKIVKLNI
jgi:DNA polymerase